jgi:molecular chaperone GrpE
MEEKQKGAGQETPLDKDGDRPLQPAEQAGGAEGDDLLTQLSTALREAHDLEDRMLRLAAEFENYKKRMQREREISLKYAEENLLKELLPTLDNLERAMEQGRNSDSASALLQGVEMTYQGLMGTLEKFGLQALDGLGKVFDPNYHEALAMESSEEIPANTIISEFQRGYLYKDHTARRRSPLLSWPISSIRRRNIWVKRLPTR